MQGPVYVEDFYPRPLPPDLASFLPTTPTFLMAAVSLLAALLLSGMLG